MQVFCETIVIQFKALLKTMYITTSYSSLFLDFVLSAFFWIWHVKW